MNTTNDGSEKFLARWVGQASLPIRNALLGLVAVPLLALLMFLASDTYQRYRTATEEAYQVSGALLSSTVKQTDRFLGNAKHILAELSTRPDVRSLDPLRCDPILGDVKKLQPAFANVFTLDRNGHTVCSVAPITAETAKGPDPKYFFTELSQTQKFTVGKPAKGFITGRWISSLAYPLKDDAGQFIGAVVAPVDLENYRPLISSDLPPAMSVGITTSDGIIISRSSDADRRIGSVVDSAAFRSMLKQREGRTHAKNYLGEGRFYVFAPIENTNWITFASISETAVIAPAIKAAIQQLLWLLGMILAIALLTIWLSRRIARPIEAIATAMEKVADGALNERAIPSGLVEVRKIATSLNHMLDSRDRADADLRQSEERFRGLFEHTRQPTLLIEEGRIIAANRATLDILGMHCLDQLVGCSMQDISPESQPDGARSDQKSEEVLAGAFEFGSNDVEWVHLRAHGDPITVRVLVTKLHQEGKTRFHVVWTDITEQKAAIARIKFLAFTDVLTGLPNKTAALDHLSHAILNAKNKRSSVGVLHIDLNKLKYVNETYGHAVGDLLIKAVSVRLTESMRPNKTLSRLLGDEFMVVIENAESQKDIAGSCERILAHLFDPYDVEGHQLVTTFAIGVAMYPQDGESSDVLLRNADTALSAAKLVGPNRYRFFEPIMNAEIVRFTETRDALRLALKRNEFELHYQPQIDLRTSRIIGAEALLRWNRPNCGLVMPNEFIGVAEESGLIVEIGRWVLNEVCRQAAMWSTCGMSEFVFAVNLSAVQFRQGRVEQDVYEALFHNRLNPANLELELTESILLQNDEPVMLTLAHWKERGIHISIDDFGTGYSSLAYLKRLKVDKLKIDQSFTRNLATDDEDRAIVHAIVEIARVLNLKTIAEGVEDHHALEELKLLGCDEAQGYLYSKPMPALDFERWINARSAT